MIDNYDSFTFNLVQYLGELYKGEIRVFRNDRIGVEELEKLDMAALIVSPGPCTPREAGVSVEAIRKIGLRIPVLGVCLGHQSIGYAFGGSIVRAPYLMHGKVSDIRHNGKGIYKGIPDPLTATRYHSLIIERESCPQCLEITSETEDGIIMGVQHRELPIYGVQFHPESILTGAGKKLLGNFLAIAARRKKGS